MKIKCFCKRCETEHDYITQYCSRCGGSIFTYTESCLENNKLVVEEHQTRNDAFMKWYNSDRHNNEVQVLS